MISIHALREEGDRFFLLMLLTSFQFLSTPSARRATDGDYLAAVIVAISIHALREEGDPSGQTCAIMEQKISIHALREEGDSGSSA